MRHRTSSPESDTDDYEEPAAPGSPPSPSPPRNHVVAPAEDVAPAQRQPRQLTKSEYDASVLAGALPQTPRHQRSQAARRQSFSSLVDTGKSYGEAPADDAPPSSLKRDIHRSGGQKRSSASSTPWAKKPKSNTPEEVLQRKREGKTSSRFHGVSWHDRENPWVAFHCHGASTIRVGAYAEETEAALGYNQAVKDAGQEHKMNPVDANGQPIPKPGY